jgi:glycosyltransferase involved in cell wall biosynthesis
MQIAIYENLPPGGAKRAAYEFGRYLAQRHTVDLYQLSTTSTRAFDLAPHVRDCYRYPYRPLFGLLDRRLRQGRLAPRSLTMFRPLRAVHRRMASDLRRRSYDLVLAHTDSLTQSPYLLRWLPQSVGVYYCHEVLRASRERPILEAHRRNLARSRPPLGALRTLEDSWVMARWVGADRRTVAAAGSVVVNSRYTGEQVWSAYGRESTVCSPGVDTETFSPPKTPARGRELLSVGSPVSIKGHDLAIRALAQIPAGPGRPGLRIVTASLVGVEPLERLARAHGVDIVVESSLDEAALVERYRKAMATICAARLEPFGLTALESMACGTPVIAVREGGFAETVVDAQTGLLADASAAGLAVAISALVGDGTLAERLGTQARAHVLAGWTWDRRAARLEAVLQGMRH